MKPPRRGQAALLLSLATHLVLFLALLAWPTTETPRIQPPEPSFIELSFFDLEPEPTPTPEPAPVLPPEEEVEPPIESTQEESKPRTPSVASTINKKTEEGTPVKTDAQPQGAAEASEATATAGVEGIGPNPTDADGNGGLAKGPLVLNARSMLPLYSVGGLVDAPGKKRSDIKKAFVASQAGGAAAPVSSVNAGNQQELGAVKKVFVGYLRKMHERLHPKWAEGALKNFERSECNESINDPDLAVTLEIVLNADGGLERAAPIETSKSTEFDTAAVGAVFDAAPYPAPPSFIQSYDGKVYIHWTLHRDNRQCGSQYARAYILTNPKLDSATQPVQKEYTEEEQQLIAEAEKQFPTLKESRGFRKEFVSAVSKIGESCKEKLKLLRDSIKEDGFLRTLIQERLKAYIPNFDGLKEEEVVDFLKSFKAKEFCKGTPAYTIESQQGSPDDIAFPTGQCDPSCREICFTF